MPHIDATLNVQQTDTDSMYLTNFKYIHVCHSRNLHSTGVTLIQVYIILFEIKYLRTSY